MDIGDRMKEYEKVSRHFFSHKSLHKKNRQDMHDMLFEEGKTGH